MNPEEGYVDILSHHSAIKLNANDISKNTMKGDLGKITIEPTALEVDGTGCRL